MTRATMLTLLRRSLEAWDHQVEHGDVGPPTSAEVFGVLRRSLGRGVDRIDEWGSIIVNEPARDPREALQWFLSGVVQTLTASAKLLEEMPIPDELAHAIKLQAVTSRSPDGRPS